MEDLFALIALTVMEIVLGIDNIIFIAILTDRLPEHQQSLARRLGLTAAMATRILLLLAINWVMRLTTPLLTLTGLGVPAAWFADMPEETARQIIEISGRDLLLFGGGLFLIQSSVREVHTQVEGREHGASVSASRSFGVVLLQIAVFDIIFSFDSVITAIGMADHLPVMILAIVVAVAVMMFFAGPISGFVKTHPTLKMLALSFLILIGVMLVAEAIGTHIEKGYIYFAMAFAVIVEFLNLKVRQRHDATLATGSPPVDLDPGPDGTN